MKINQPARNPFEYYLKEYNNPKHPLNSRQNKILI